MPKQSHYKGNPTYKSVLFAFWDTGEEGDDYLLAEEVGCALATVRSYRNEWRLLQRSDTPQIVEVVEGDLPLETVHGWMWTVPCEMHRTCKRCERLAECKVAVRDGNFVACERVFESELLPKERV